MSPCFSVRPYRSLDRDALYAVCLATGRSGADASGLFDDPALLGHRYVGPYLDLEPGLCFTLEDEGGPCGYVLGTADTERFYDRFVHEWLPPLLQRLERPSGDPRVWSEDERLLAELHSPTLLVPRDLATYPAHLHIDLLPRAQGQGLGRRMMERLLDAFVAHGAPGVHLGVGAGNTRAQGFYRALGFEELAPERPRTGAVLMGRRLP